MDLFEQQRSNRRRTWLVMVVFVAFLAFLGYGFDFFYLGTRMPIVAVVALLIGSISAIVSYRRGDAAVLASASATPLGEAMEAASTDTERLKLKQFENVVAEMSIASGLPQPKLYVVPDADPNAFAAGRGPERSSIAVTRGLLDSLDREELQAVVAHEMSHIRNFDVRLMTVVAALVGAVVLLSDFATRGMSWGGGSRRSSSRDKDSSKGGGLGAALFVLWIIAVILAPFIGQLMATMVSRRREFMADASAAELTRNPLALARALEQIELAVEPTRLIKRGTANLCIADPLGRAVGRREGRFADLFATHPPMVKRIAALREMAYERSQG